MIVKKTPEEIERMGAAGDILARCLALLRAKARPGVTTAQLDEAAERFIRSQRAEPAFKGYRGFPGSICTSPNSMVVHGIPGSYKLKRGDILSVDVGVVLDGWVADAAITLPIGPVTPIAARLLKVTREALFAAVEACRPQNKLGDVSHAVQQHVEAGGFSVIRSLVGHGIGRDMHEDPQIPNFGKPDTGPCSRRGWCWRSSRWSTRGRTRSGWAPTTGPSTRRTGRSRRTSSTPSRSPPRGRGSSPRGTSKRSGAPHDSCYLLAFARGADSWALRCNLVGTRPRGAMKVRASVKPMCEKCKIIRRHGAVLVICQNPRHKQKQG